MRKIKVVIEGNGTIRIKLKKKEEISSRIMPETERSATSTIRNESISLSSSLINQMEIRVESVFRPKVQDVEVVYALSGQNGIVDRLHNLSSNEVVAHATPDMITYTAEKMMEYIREERTKTPELIIHVHSHPSGLPELSDIDRDSMKKVAKRVREIIPDATIIFGVHAVSDEHRQRRIPPQKVSENWIRWSSITRIHEVAFFDENTRPVVVRINE